MEEKTLKFPTNGNGLLSLHSELEVCIIKLVGKRKSKLFCAKREHFLTPSFILEHECLKPKKIYETKEGKRIVIYCPKLMVLKLNGEAPIPFYKEYEDVIYESLEQICLVRTEFKHKPRPLEKKEGDVFSRTQKNINSIKRAFFELQGSS